MLNIKGGAFGAKRRRAALLLLTEGQADDTFRTDLDASELAQIFNRSIRSVFLDWCIADGAFDLVREGVKYCEEWLLPALNHSITTPTPSGMTTISGS